MEQQDTGPVTPHSPAAPLSDSATVSHCTAANKDAEAPPSRSDVLQPRETAAERIYGGQLRSLTSST